ncbi:MAG: sulfurtransferase-like selenium metabolism protein YedF [Acidobacteria bacterium]|nr:sulfurtransferase-like selenium metabolism protein YedF [Acidobacteriota bacterium]
MSRVIDARGLACPQPVLLTKKAIAEENRVTAIVDGETARQNVTRMAEKQGCRVQAEEREDGIYLSITREGEAAEQARIAPGTLPAGGPLVVSVASEFMGRGDDVLGNILIRAFFHTLGEVEPRPDVLVFYNSGVKLAVEGSPVLEDLRDLEEGGVRLLICGTCLGHYELKDKVAVGEVSNMYSIAETLLGAGKVVSV